MRWWIWAAVLFVAGLAITATAWASVPMGVFALIDEVVFEPNATKPERVRIWGAFSLAAGKRGSTYRAPQWGYLYCKLPAEGHDLCRQEWTDLAATAGTGEVVAFGSRYEGELPAVYSGREQPAEPEPYRLGHGLQRSQNESWVFGQLLRSLPKPITPVLGGTEIECEHPGRMQEVVLTARNAAAQLADKTDRARYVFDVETEAVGLISSPPIKPGEKETSWKPWLSLTPGETVTWRVRLVMEGLELASVATARFVVKAAKK